MNEKEEKAFGKSFDNVIGYAKIKEELFKVLDMIKEPERYEKLGAKMPHGILLYGDPGIGKTTIANAFIEESGLPAYTLRRNGGGDAFADMVKETFEKAKSTAPSIVFLDDMDKFANEDESHRDAEEYVAVQAFIDDAKDTGVFVLGTANNIRKLPMSLIRSGRFDRVIEMDDPTPADAEKIVKYYLSSKRVSPDVNLDDVAKMINYNSCAELESMVNDAAINAAYDRRDSIEIKDLIAALLQKKYESDEEEFDSRPSDETLKKVALHEAGHIVMAEVLSEGCVGFANIRSGMEGGFIHLCKNLTRRPYHILVSLASKAAVELSYAETVANGCEEDIEKAIKAIRAGFSTTGSAGFGMVDVSINRFPDSSESFNARNEAVAQAELEHYFLKAKDILLKNRDFLEKTADALYKKQVLLWSDIQAIRKSVNVLPVAV